MAENNSKSRLDDEDDQTKRVAELRDGAQNLEDRAAALADREETIRQRAEAIAAREEELERERAELERLRDEMREARQRADDEKAQQEASEADEAGNDAVPLEVQVDALKQLYHLTKQKVAERHESYDEELRRMDEAHAEQRAELLHELRELSGDLAAWGKARQELQSAVDRNAVGIRKLSQELLRVEVEFTEDSVKRHPTNERFDQRRTAAMMMGPSMRLRLWWAAKLAVLEDKVSRRALVIAAAILGLIALALVVLLFMKLSGRSHPSISDAMKKVPLAQLLADAQAGVPDPGPRESSLSLSREVIVEAVRRNTKVGLRECWKAGVESGDLRKGEETFVLAWTIRADGKVYSARVDSPVGLADKRVGACMAEAMQSWTFPKGKHDSIVRSFPLGPVRVP